MPKSARKSAKSRAAESPVAVVMPRDVAEALDEWASTEPDGPPLNEAIIRILVDWLESRGRLPR